MKSLKKYINDMNKDQNGKYILFSPSSDTKEYEISKDIIDIVLKK